MTIYEAIDLMYDEADGRDYHCQIAEWLEELVMLRLDSCMIHMPERLHLVENGYNKAIDDFIEKVELKYLGVHPDELYEKYYPREICKQIKEIAEQLKVGVRE